ncbi:MAG: FAD:protein FMN transferase [Zetaproteobacteria bacterium]|nr:FAD:protein FMN transferase [Zetaproteobacteria bacterium]
MLIQFKRWITLFTCTFLFASCDQPPPLHHETFFILGTLVEFTIADTPEPTAQAAILAAKDEMQRIHTRFATNHSEGETAIFNQLPAHRPFLFSSEEQQLILQAQLLQSQSQQAFQITLGALDQLWGLSQSPMRSTPPSESSIQQLLPDIDCLEPLANQQWQKRVASCQLDFGGIAKGYAIDQGIKMLKAHGIANAIINAGGDMRIIGTKHGTPWKIGIRHPRNATKTIAAVDLSGDVSIVTSGDYERFFIYNDRRYHHILDPKTGYPSDRAQSTTVIADNATLADGWSTALFVLGKEGLPIVEKYGMAALLIDHDGHLYQNQRMDSMLKTAQHPPSLSQQ